MTVFTAFFSYWGGDKALSTAVEVETRRPGLGQLALSEITSTAYVPTLLGRSQAGLALHAKRFFYPSMAAIVR